MVDDPEPGAAIVDGLRPVVTPEGWPLAVSAIAELKPPLTAVETVVFPEAPWLTVSVAGAVMEKSGFEDGLKMISSTGCSSMPLGATPVCPCRKSKNPTPVTCTGILAVWKLDVGVNRALNSERALLMPV